MFPGDGAPPPYADYAVIARVLGVEQIVVPAGSFDALVVEVTVTASHDGPELLLNEISAWKNSPFRQVDWLLTVTGRQ